MSLRLTSRLHVSAFQQYEILVENHEFLLYPNINLVNPEVFEYRRYFFAFLLEISTFR